MTDNKIKLEVEAAAVKGLDGLEALIKKADEGRAAVQRLDAALKKMYGNYANAENDAARIQRRLRQIGAGGPETVAANAYRNQVSNTARADPARVQLSIEREISKTFEARMTLFDRYMKRWSDFTRAFDQLRSTEAQAGRVGQMTPQMTQQIARLEAAVNAAQRNIINTLPSGNLRNNLDESLTGIVGRRAAISNAQQGALVARYLNASNFSPSFEQAKQDASEMIPLYQEKLRVAQQELAVQQQIQRVERDRVEATAENRRRDRANANYTAQQLRRLNTQYNGEYSLLTDPTMRRSQFDSDLQRMREEAIQQGRTLDEQRVRQRFEELEYQRQQGAIARQNAAANRAAEAEANRPNRAQQSITAARDRMGAYGGAGIFAIQGDLLRNYAVMAGTLGSAGFLVQFTINFEKELANLQAIAAATNGEMQKLTKTFMEVAQNSKFSAQDIIQASVLMAQAGLSARDIDQSLKPIIDLATGTGTDLATTVDTVTSTMAVFGLQTNEAASIADTLTEAMNRSKLGIEQFRLGLQYAGNIAADQGVTYQELTAALAGMADQGIRAGSTLGTGLRQLLIDLENPTDKARGHFESLGLSMSQLDVRTQGLFGVLRNLQRAGFTSADAMQTMEVRAAAAFSALTANLPNVELLRTQITGTSAATQAAGTQMDTLSARFTQFSNAAGVTFVNAMKPIGDLIKDLMVALTAFLNMINGIAPALRLLVPPFVMLGLLQMGKFAVGLVQGLIDMRRNALLASGAIDGQARSLGIAAAAMQAYRASMAGVSNGMRVRTSTEMITPPGGGIYPRPRQDTAIAAHLAEIARQRQALTDEQSLLIIPRQRELLAQRTEIGRGVYERFRNAYGPTLTPGQQLGYKTAYDDATAHLTPEMAALQARQNQIQQERIVLAQRETTLQNQLAAARAKGTAALTAEAAAENVAVEAQQVAITTYTASTARFATVQGVAAAAAAGLKTAMGSMVTAFTAAPFTSAAVAIGVIVSVMQVLDMLFESNAEKADRLNTEISQLQGEMDNTHQTLTAVRDQLQHVEDRSVGLADETLNLSDRQQGLQDVIAETTQRFGQLTGGMANQINTIGDLRAALLQLERDQNDVLLQQAQLVEQRNQEKAATARTEVRQSYNSARLGVSVDGRAVGMTSSYLQEIARNDPALARALQQAFSNPAAPTEGPRLQEFINLGSRVSAARSGVTRRLDDNTLNGADRHNIERLNNALTYFGDRLDRIGTAAGPLIDVERDRASNRPAVIAGELRQQAGYEAALTSVDDAIKNFRAELTTLQNSGLSAAQIQERTRAMQQDGSYRAALTAAQATIAQMRGAVERQAADQYGLNQSQASSLTRAAMDSLPLGSQVNTLAGMLNQNAYLGASGGSGNLVALARSDKDLYASQQRELIRRAQGKNRGSLDSLLEEAQTLAANQMAAALAEFDADNNANPNAPNFANTLLGRQRQNVIDQATEDKETLLETLRQSYGRNDRGGRHGRNADTRLLQLQSRATKEELDATLQNLSGFNDPSQIATAQQAFETKFAEYQSQRLEQFSAEWDDTQWSDPAAAANAKGLASAEVSRELAASLEEGRRKFDDAIIATLVERTTRIVNEAQRTFDTAVANGQFRVDLLNGLRNRGRAGTVRGQVEERRAEQNQADALPALLAANQQALSELIAQRTSTTAARAAATTPERQAALDANLRDLQTRIDEKTAQVEDLDRRNRVNTEVRPPTAIFNPRDQRGENGMFTEDFKSQVNEGVRLWEESAGIMRDVADQVVDAIVNAFDTLNSSMKENIKGVLTGAKSVKDGIRDMASSVLETMLDMAIQMLTNQLIKTALNFFLNIFSPGSTMGTGAGGAPVAKHAAGGNIRGGIPNRDSVHALLQPGEFVFKKSAADMIGRDTLAHMNATGKVSSAIANNVIPMAMKRDPDMTNVWVVSPDQVPQQSAKDIIVEIQRDVARGGPMKKMIKAVAMGQV